MANPYASAYSPEEEHANVWSAGVPALVAFAAGLVMVALPLTQLLAKIIAYQVHKTIGLLVPPLVPLLLRKKTNLTSSSKKLVATKLLLSKPCVPSNLN